MYRRVFAATWILALLAAHASALEPSRGTAKFAPRGDQAEIPERYRLADHAFDWEAKPLRTLPVASVETFHVTFPSPVTTKYPENNVVHAEWSRPAGARKIPAVIVLDITGGNQQLSRTIARHLAQNGIGGMFVQMAYYGPRRPAGKSVRLLSTDVDHTIEAVRQTVLDLRRATAWLEHQPEVDASRLGIMGTSLGSFVAALTSEMEPKLGRVCVLLGGGGFVDAFWDDLRVIPARKIYEIAGGSREKLKTWIAPVDPITRADLLRERKVLIVGAKNDEIVPPKMAEDLWIASGRQRILWLDAGHYTAALYLATSLGLIVDHFGPGASKARRE